MEKSFVGYVLNNDGHQELYAGHFASIEEAKKSTEGIRRQGYEVEVYSLRNPTAGVVFLGSLI